MKVSKKTQNKTKQKKTTETENPLKMTKNAFYFMLNALFIIEIFKFLSWLFGYVAKWFDKKVKVNFKTFDVTDLTTNNYNTDITWYLKK